MKHTECKDCKYRKGNCGYHFKMDGTTNFDIASLSACDKYGNCMFFERDEEDESKGDLISREALKGVISKSVSEYSDQYSTDMLNMWGLFTKIIDNAPTIVTTNDEILIKEYLSKCNCCDECFAEIYCITHDLRDSRCPSDYCVSNIKDYLKGREKGEEE